jgi:hypothetical protein
MTCSNGSYSGESCEHSAVWEPVSHKVVGCSVCGVNAIVSRFQRPERRPGGKETIALVGMSN